MYKLKNKNKKHPNDINKVRINKNKKLKLGKSPNAEKGHA